MEARPDNVLLYATSNRRHLMPRHFADNEEYHRHGEEIIPGETTEEKISLSERFGLWLGFYPFDQVMYLDICIIHLQRLGMRTPQAESREEKPCAGPCSTARAVAGWRGNSPATGPGLTP